MLIDHLNHLQSNGLQNTTKLQMAKKQLNSIEEKFRKFNQNKSNDKKNQYSRRTHEDRTPNYNTLKQQENLLVPDLKQYFSFMMEKENQPQANNSSQKIQQVYQRQEPNTNIFSQQNKSLLIPENVQKINKISIQKKICEQKTQAISNLQNFFMNKKSQLEAKIQQLQQAKIKAIHDTNLLKRNNSQLQNQIQIEKSMIYKDATQSLKYKNQQLESKIKKKKKNIQALNRENDKIKRRKQQLKKNINDCLKGNKYLLSYKGVNDDC